MKIFTFILLLQILVINPYNLQAQWQRSQGLYGGQVYGIIENGNNLFIGTHEGIFRAEYGAQLIWTRLNTGFSGQVIMLFSSNSILYASSLHNLYRSTDNGESWNLTLNGSVMTMASIGSTIFAQISLDVLMKSTDLGTTWQTLQPPQTDIYSLEAKNNLLFIGTGSSKIFVTSDLGETWQDVSTGLNNILVYTMASNSTEIYAAGYGADAIYRSTNDGLSWNSISLAGTIQVRTLLLVNNHLYAGKLFGGIVHTSDQGANWNEFNSGLTDLGINKLVNYNNQMFAGTAWGGIFQTDVNVANWQQANQGLTSVWVEDILSTTTTTYAGTASGVFISTDSGINWTQSPLYTYVMCFSSLGNLIFAGTWNYDSSEPQGVYISSDDGASWYESNSGLNPDYLRVMALTTYGSKVFLGTNGDGLYVSTNQGAYWTHTGLNQTHIWSLYIKGDAIFAGTSQGVFMSSDQGNTWINRNSGLGTNLIWEFSGLNNSIYVGTSNGVFRTTNDGVSWSPFNAGLPSFPHNGVYSLNTFNDIIYAGTHTNAYQGAIFDSQVYSYSESSNYWTLYADGIVDYTQSINSIEFSSTKILAGTAGAGICWIEMKSLDLTAPNGGENWQTGSVHDITWSWINVNDVKIEYTTNNGSNWITVIASTPSDGSYSWTIPNTPSTQCKVKITDVTNASVTDESNEAFTISQAPSVTVTSPNGGENWQTGSVHDITWSWINVNDVKIEYTTNNGSNWITVIASTPSDGSYSWTIPNTPSTQCKVKITDVTNASVTDQSDGVFTIYLPQGITVLRPNGNEDWPVGATDTIKWYSQNVNQVEIRYTSDGGSNWILVATPQGAAGKYAWTLPETSSRNCKVRVSDVTNPSVNDISNNSFTITYQLFRLLNNGYYEKFDKEKHWWSFKQDSAITQPPFNQDSIMWPEYWWEQFNYWNPLIYDPLLFFDQKEYYFPDWPLWVDVFTENQCYLLFLPNYPIYRIDAVEKWKNKNAIWGGSCFGFAISTFFAFDDSVKFKIKFPDFPGWLTNIRDITFWDGDVEKANKIRKVINNLWTHQWGKVQIDYRNAIRNNSIGQTVDELKAMLKSVDRDDKIIYLIKEDLSTGHALNGFKLQEGVTFDTIYVYDSNDALNTRFIVIDKINDRWTYPYGSFTNYSSQYGLLLSDPISNYYANPMLKSENFLQEKRSNSDFVEIYNNQNANITITNSQGNYIGCINDSLVNTLQDGIPLVPITSNLTPPIGYYIPKENYTVELVDKGDSTVYITLFTDSVMMKFIRDDGLLNQKDIIQSDSIFAIINPDAVVKEFHFEAVVPDTTSEKYFKISSSLNLDSISFQMQDLTNLILYNFGSPKFYGVSLRYANQESEEYFENNSLTIPTNSSHLMIPDWENVSTNSLIILVDVGMNGTYDDTLEVQNMLTELPLETKLGIPKEYNLRQNFPNPFNSVTTIEFALPEPGLVTLIIYNILGEQIETLLSTNLVAGNYKYQWNAGNVTSGIYLYQLQAGSFIETKKMILLK